ncbi:MAG: DUF3784 domain-containing protein [Lachnospiraceae bacterium]|nr:DUF3784 domain-containing protein [Lachnospiraceae bacterium]
MIGEIIIGLIGFTFIVFGYLIWKKEKISLLHSYHYDKVTNENKKAFCIISGIGVTIIGAGLLITSIIIGITNSEWSFVAFIIGFIIGLIMLMYAGLRYNN